MRLKREEGEGSKAWLVGAVHGKQEIVAAPACSPCCHVWCAAVSPYDSSAEVAADRPSSFRSRAHSPLLQPLGHLASPFVIHKYSLLYSHYIPLLSHSLPSYCFLSALRADQRLHLFCFRLFYVILLFSRPRVDPLNPVSPFFSLYLTYRIVGQTVSYKI